MTIWIIIIALAVSIAAIMVLPMFLSRNISGTSRKAYDIAVYKDQLAEVERDLKRNIISEAEAESLRFEIQKRVLATADKNNGTDESNGKASAIAMKPSAVVMVLAALIPLAGGALYLNLGSPNTPDFPYAERTDIEEARAAASGHGEGSEDAPSMSVIIDKLKERLQQEPSDLEGWSMLARSLMTLDRFNEAAQAFKTVYELSGNIMDKSDYAEALLMASNSNITPEILSIFVEINTLNPLDPRAQFYIGMEALQRNDTQVALQIWFDLLYLSPLDAAWIPAVEKQINLAANDIGFDPNTLKPSQQAIETAAQAGINQGGVGPTAEDIENAQSMTSSEQDDMIRSMVQRLADRLSENPDDPEGWTKLARAYEVLGEMDKAKTARRMAEEFSK